MPLERLVASNIFKTKFTKNKKLAIFNPVLPLFMKTKSNALTKLTRAINR
nr:MAG TPA: hypothetical protein [Caudoviricetes sp.]DAL89309.1 MAG TPA: hypothetical protein [Caudoviricetes sp.]